MAQVEIMLPAMGEGVIEATITKWLVKEGDHVNEDDSLVEIATDKVDSEVPSPYSGVVKEILVREGETPQVGQVIARLETEKEMESSATEEVRKEVERIKSTPSGKKTEPVSEEKESPAQEKRLEKVAEAEEIPLPPEQTSHTPSGRFLSPLIRRIAEKENLGAEELDSIQGTGLNNRLTKNDILQFLEKRKTGKVKQPEQAATETTARKPDLEQQAAAGAVTASSGEDEIIQMDRMRKLISEHMVRSKQISPHVTSFIEVDMTAVVEWRNRVKDGFLQREGQKFTFMPIFIEAAALALRDYPMVNVSVDGDRIIKKKNIHVGMATALPNGNLIVPVIKNADEKNLIGLAKTVNDLARRARSNQLKPDEITGGTFTITNFGTFDSLTGTPIINQPEAAILGIGAIRKKPAVIETPAGDAIGIRHIMILSLSYDHRVVDGALGGMYLKKVAEYLEDFDTGRVV
ncbi:MAG TPA: 2-oxo acid dehydrogenase subunit E2 [Bacteroidetes bacterium]|nr:2-oxo acid dehydrogenase subunit E2 [Bacteroidota bacterium]